MKVLKFGGSSVKDADAIRRSVQIFSSEPETAAVICSAMKGVTDQLIAAASLCENGDPKYRNLLDEIHNRHSSAASELLTNTDDYLENLAIEEHQLAEICHGVFLVKECSPRSRDLIMSFGERLSNQLIASYAAETGLRVSYLDARPLILTDNSHGNAVVEFDTSFARIRQAFGIAPASEGVQASRGQTDPTPTEIKIVTGFIASDSNGITTTLGRNGSDYSASIFGAALNASDIEIWTDVDGVLEADPRIVPNAGVIPDLSIDEAMEMSYFGAEVLHPSTMIPAVKAGIPVWIKNSINPSARGTRIAGDVPVSERAVTGIAGIKHVSLINIVGGGMIGARGTAMKIFSALAKADVNAIMISQASSEHSICVVMREDECPAAIRSLESELEYELSHQVIQEIEVKEELEVLAIIGGNMRGQPGISGTLFSSLGDAGINILAIAQGSSEMNVSFVIHKTDHVRAVQTVHAAFFPGAGG